MSTIGDNLQAVQARIARAAAASGRGVRDVALIAVSKSVGADAIRTAHAHGQHAFGENYVQEALEKMSALRDLSAADDAASPATEGGTPKGVEWHFIGPIQSNKTRAIAESFAWVHSVDRIKVAQRLAAARPSALVPLQICIQVNIGMENTKSGVSPPDALSIARVIAGLPQLRLRGLMAVPPPTQDNALQRRYFSELRELKAALTAAGFSLDTLSMGMSDDLEAAIAEGATMVRVGTAIFGARRRAAAGGAATSSGQPA
jgi:pyridoxal phosphate enzyme (YggS family)